MKKIVKMSLVGLVFCCFAFVGKMFGAGVAMRIFEIPVDGRLKKVVLWSIVHIPDEKDRSAMWDADPFFYDEKEMYSDHPAHLAMIKDLVETVHFDGASKVPFLFEGDEHAYRNILNLNFLEHQIIRDFRQEGVESGCFEFLRGDVRNLGTQQFATWCFARMTTGRNEFPGTPLEGFAPFEYVQQNSEDFHQLRQNFCEQVRFLGRGDLVPDEFDPKMFHENWTSHVSMALSHGFLNYLDMWNQSGEDFIDRLSPAVVKAVLTSFKNGHDEIVADAGFFINCVEQLSRDDVETVVLVFGHTHAVHFYSMLTECGAKLVGGVGPFYKNGKKVTEEIESEDYITVGRDVMFLTPFQERACLSRVLGIEDNEFARHFCNWCGRSGGKNQCARCGVSQYCSRMCQINSWNSGHQTRCRNVREDEAGFGMVRRRPQQDN